MADRVTHEVVEGLYTGTPTVLVTHKVVESIYVGDRTVRVTHRVVEVLYAGAAAAAGPPMQVVWID